MSFKQCCLVPKPVYDSMVSGARLEDIKSSKPRPKNSFVNPADVQAKYYDYNTKFPSQSIPLAKGSKFSPEGDLLGNIQSVGKKNLARDIVSFIVSRTGGEIEWNKDFKVKISGKTFFDMDIRDILSLIVGAQEDFQGKALELIDKLQELNAPSYFFMFYKGPVNVMPRKYDYEDRYNDMKDEKDSFGSFDDSLTSQDESDDEGSEHEVTFKPDEAAQFRQHSEESQKRIFEQKNKTEKKRNKYRSRERQHQMALRTESERKPSLKWENFP